MSFPAPEDIIQACMCLPGPASSWAGNKRQNTMEKLPWICR